MRGEWYGRYKYVLPVSGEKDSALPKMPGYGVDFFKTRGDIRVLQDVYLSSAIWKRGWVEDRGELGGYWIERAAYELHRCIKRLL